jgi:light-regulated signal transduction histidine kinase (bacteriophytochrome)
MKMLCVLDSPQAVQENKEHLTAQLAKKAHDMRNALACIHQFGNILVDGLAGDLSDEQREYVGIMLENASTIRKVLDSGLEGTSGLLEEATNKIDCLSKINGQGPI